MFIPVLKALKASALAATSNYQPGVENGLRNVIEMSWRGQVIYDPYVDEASLEGLSLCLLYSRNH